MRFVAALLFWLVTTVALAVAVPAAWAQHNIVSADGYAALAQSAADDPQLQAAMAAELTSTLLAVASANDYDVGTDAVRAVASAYTASPAFPGQFASANQIVHRWMFTDAAGQTDSSGRWQIDLSPMLADPAFTATLQRYGVQAPSTLTVPLTENVPNSLRPGQLRQLSTWGPWVSSGATVLAGVSALLTLAAARRRGKALAILGLSGLLVGAGGWAGLEIARRYISAALNDTTGDIHEIADVMVSHAESSLHQWLNLTLAAGGILVVLGIIASVLGTLLRR